MRSTHVPSQLDSAMYSQVPSEPQPVILEVFWPSLGFHHVMDCWVSSCFLETGSIVTPHLHHQPSFPSRLRKPYFFGLLPLLMGSGEAQPCRAQALTSPEDAGGNHKVQLTQQKFTTSSLQGLLIIRCLEVMKLQSQNCPCTPK